MHTAGKYVLLSNPNASHVKALAHYRLYQNEQLLQLLAKGDEGAFAEIYDRYWKTLYAIAYSHVRDACITEDILHEVFISLWHNRGASIHSLDGYLASATKYQVFALLKKNERFKQYRRSLPLSTSPDPEPETYLHHKQLMEFIAGEVDALPEKCRLIFRNSRERGMTTREIAVEMKISPKTVENQINKALHHLKFSMKKIMQTVLLCLALLR